ncbi:MAG: tetratricopeptide repeat protein [Pseudomonadota bacterium]
MPDHADTSVNAVNAVNAMTASTVVALSSLRSQGLAHLNAGEPVAAIAVFRRVLQSSPDDVDSWDHLAAALTMTDQYEAAEQAYQQCFRLGCSFPETLSNAARNAGYWGKPRLQYEHAQRLLQLEGPLRHEGLRHCVEALRREGRQQDALAACRQLLLELPDDFETRKVIVRVLLDAGQPEAAQALCTELLAAHPDHPSLRLSRIEACIATGDMDAGIAHAEQLLQAEPDNIDAMSALGFHYQFAAAMTAAQRRAHAERFGEALRRRVIPFQHWDNERSAPRVLRVGIISGDLRNHPVAFFMLTMLEALQQSSLQFFVYDVLQRPDKVTDRIRPLVSQWHDVQGIKDDDLAALIRRDTIDILLDVQGFMTGNRLAVLARKPAPVQVSWMGFLGSTGTPSIDYVLVDQYCVPHGAEQEFVEPVWRLPGHTLCFTPPEVDCPEAAPPAVTNGYITFGCLNNPHKLNDRVLTLWQQVLVQIPTARLLLKGGGFHSKTYRTRFAQRLAALGFDMQRVTLEGPAPRHLFLQTYNRIDIALDPFPCSGVTTTAEALWAGAPVLALRGDRLVWRMAASLLTAASLSDWVAATPAEFVEQAVARAADLDALVTLRSTQRARVLRSALFDAPRFAAQFEEALQGMWKEYVDRG